MIRDIKRDYRRYKNIGEDIRPDLKEFIQEKDLGKSTERKIKLPIKIVDIPEFEYARGEMPVVVQGEGDSGEESEEEGEEGDEPGEGSAEHDYYEMDPEEFAKALDEELDLQQKDRGRVKFVEEGDYTDIYRYGPSTTLDFNSLFKESLKNEKASYFDENYVTELLKVEGINPEEAFVYCRNNNINVSKKWIDERYDNIDEYNKWNSIKEFEENVDRQEFSGRNMNDIRYRREDEQYKQPREVPKKVSQVVIINIRDVSGSMKKGKRELVERIFSPLDWYLQSKYEKAEFRYIAHDTDAWEVDRDDFFGIKSGGGTKISSAYDLLEDILEEYPWQSWNRYIFASGDGENSSSDSKDKVCPKLREIEANMHAYFQVGKSQNRTVSASHANVLEKNLTDLDNLFVSRVEDNEDLLPAIKDALRSEGDNND